MLDEACSWSVYHGDGVLQQYGLDNEFSLWTTSHGGLGMSAIISGGLLRWSSPLGEHFTLAWSQYIPVNAFDQIQSCRMPLAVLRDHRILHRHHPVEDSVLRSLSGHGIRW